MEGEKVSPWPGVEGVIEAVFDSEVAIPQQRGPAHVYGERLCRVRVTRVDRRSTSGLRVGDVGKWALRNCVLI